MSEYTYLRCERPAGNVVVVRFVGLTKISSDVVDQLGRELDQLMDEDDGANVIMNFEGIESVCSAMLGNLVRLRKRADSESREHKLCNLSDLVSRILRMVQLHKFFEIHDTEDAAISSFGPAGESGSG